MDNRFSETGFNIPTLFGFNLFNFIYKFLKPCITEVRFTKLAIQVRQQKISSMLGGDTLCLSHLTPCCDNNAQTTGKPQKPGSQRFPLKGSNSVGKGISIPREPHTAPYTGDHHHHSNYQDNYHKVPVSQQSHSSGFLHSEYPQCIDQIFRLILVSSKKKARAWV